MRKEEILSQVRELLKTGGAAGRREIVGLLIELEWLLQEGVR